MSLSDDGVRMCYPQPRFPGSLPFFPPSIIQFWIAYWSPHDLDIENTDFIGFVR